MTDLSPILFLYTLQFCVHGHWHMTARLKTQVHIKFTIWVFIKNILVISNSD